MNATIRAYLKYLSAKFKLNWSKAHWQKSVNASSESAYVFFALLTNHGASCVRINTLYQFLKETADKSSSPPKSSSGVNLNKLEGKKWTQEVKQLNAVIMLSA